MHPIAPIEAFEGVSLGVSLGMPPAPSTPSFRDRNELGIYTTNTHKTQVQTPTPAAIEQPAAVDMTYRSPYGGVNDAILGGGEGSHLFGCAKIVTVVEVSI